ncbi:MAG: hypothetical protein AB1600_01160 [Bacteroidota bacterium]
MRELKETKIPTSAVEIKIIGLNIDKTQKVNRSDTAYNIYFELSGIPSQVWKIIFEREWKSKTSSTQAEEKTTEAGVDRGFLVIHCPLQEVAIRYLPLLNEAVTSTNSEYKRYLQRQELEQVRRENLWKEERQSVYEMAQTLNF